MAITVEKDFIDVCERCRMIEPEVRTLRSDGFNNTDTMIVVTCSEIDRCRNVARMMKNADEAKREEQEPDRRHDPSRCGGLGGPNCETCDMICPYR